MKHGHYDLVATKYKGVYVTCCGKVFRTVHGEIREVSGSPDSKRYLAISVVENGKRKTVQFHRLIAETFLGPSPLDVNHKDTHKHNNAIDNLEYMTPKENNNHAFENGLGVQKLTDVEVAALIKDILNGEDASVVAKRYKISKIYLFEIMRKEKRQHAWALLGNPDTIPTRVMSVERCAEMIKEALSGAKRSDLCKKYGVHRSYLYKVLRKDFREDAWALVEGSTTIESIGAEALNKRVE